MESDFRPLNPCLTVLPCASVLKPVRNPTIAANQLRLWACNREVVIGSFGAATEVQALLAAEL